MFALISQKGKILQYQSNDQAPAGSDLRTFAVDEMHDPDRFYFMDDDTVALRPELPELPDTGTAPLVIDLSVLVGGATATVADEFGATLDLTDFTDPLQLIDPGRYVLTVTQPFPHKSFTQEIEVTDA